MLEKEYLNPKIWRSVREREQKNKRFMEVNISQRDDYVFFASFMTYKQWASLRATHSAIHRFGDWETRNKKRPQRQASQFRQNHDTQLAMAF